MAYVWLPLGYGASCASKDIYSREPIRLGLVPHPGCNYYPDG
jgi:hypothetical protein